MSDRERNYHKTYIDYTNNPNGDDVDVIVFDINEPRGNLSRNKEYWPNYNATQFSARMNIQKGIVRRVEFENNNKKEKVLQIARSYRPGIGRHDSVLYASLILNFYNIPIESSPLKNLRLPRITIEPDNLIKNEILEARLERHPNNNTNHNKPRFITIPYSTEIKTGLPKLIGAGHFVTLIVDQLDYKDNDNNFKPFVYVYDSAHMLCEGYGVFNNRLNKDSYFKFGNNILVDNEVFNNDRNICCCFGGTNLSNRVQKISDFRCGYYTEAAIDLLLENDKFTDNDGENIPYGNDTRKFLMEILSNENIRNQLNLVLNNISYEIPYEKVNKLNI